MPASKVKYSAVCMVCYHCMLNPGGVSKREAEMTATSHIGAYRHDVVVQALPIGNQSADRTGKD